ncbi:DUF732 domain-containing protein [Mycobacterium sp. IDR2000157661]|uniref:DUF732 domain-containing protein n=1 Tax=Mycobacterium sp. IDR2000157661 TaxID=2867005 RepID=UPI001EEC23E5|nr:DUF732 domain-containing protein [Mycobacterium sp. IDR2000157661]ULE32080.1 DUF732 domain-containing protein [Mycobacterium sp. IDR2000157661]
MSAPRRFATATIAAAAVALAALGSAATAAATSVDDAFIDVISERGIAFTSADAAVEAGLVVCSLVDDGATPVEAAEIVDEESGLSAPNAGFFVGASIASFCPEYGDLI